MNYEFELTEENLKDSLINDKLKRNSKINNLLKLMSSLKRNTIISIDGAWGSGKTVFVKQIETLNKVDFTFNDGKIKDINNIDKTVKDSFNDNHIVYYYNAWENDLHTDPLQSLLLFLLNELPNNEDAIVDWKEFKKILPSHILKILSGLGSGVITGINTKAKELTGIDFKETIGATVDLVKDINDLKDYTSLAESIITINEIKTAIDDLINCLLKGNKKIVFIIDELDRCRPDYAVKLLETITHFYNNNKLIFLVSSNNEQLSYTISKFYGDKFDGYGYLNKIFNFIISLEKIDPSTFARLVLNINFDSTWVDMMALAIIEYNNFSMREIGRYIYYQEILSNYYNTTYSSYHDENSLLKYVFLPYCLGLKLKDIKKYNEFLNGNGIDDFISLLSKNNNCQIVTKNIFNHDSGIKQEDKEKITIEEYVRNTYKRYFIDNNRDNYHDQEAKKRFSEVLSLISDFSNIY